MKKLAAIIGAIAVAGTLALTATPAAAQPAFSFGFSTGPGYWRGYDDYRPHHRNYYPRHRSGISIGPGGIDIRVTPPRVRGHVARCEARYRSYNRFTDMYLGYDGKYHRCRL